MSRVLLVGESNPYDDRYCGDAYFALYPEPPGCAGARLCDVLGMTKREYLRTFDRVNLLGQKRWSVPLAREAAARLTSEYRVLLGARVAQAHGFAFAPFAEVGLTGSGAAWRGVILPHPSGRSRLWNEPGAAERARQLVLNLVASAGEP